MGGVRELGRYLVDNRMRDVRSAAKPVRDRCIPIDVHEGTSM